MPYDPLALSAASSQMAFPEEEQRKKGQWFDPTWLGLSGGYNPAIFPQFSMQAPALQFPDLGGGTSPAMQGGAGGNAFSSLLSGLGTAGQVLSTGKTLAGGLKSLYNAIFGPSSVGSTTTLPSLAFPGQTMESISAPEILQGLDLAGYGPAAAATLPAFTGTGAVPAGFAGYGIGEEAAAGLLGAAGAEGGAGAGAGAGAAATGLLGPAMIAAVPIAAAVTHFTTAGTRREAERADVGNIMQRAIGDPAYAQNLFSRMQAFTQGGPWQPINDMEVRQLGMSTANMQPGAYIPGGMGGPTSVGYSTFGGIAPYLQPAQQQTLADFLQAQSAYNQQMYNQWFASDPGR